MEHKKSINNTTQNTETGTLKKPSDKLNTGSTIRTSSVPKGPLPKLRMTGGRKPAANASATGASAPKAADGTAKAVGPPAGAKKYTYAERWTAAQTLRSHTRSTVATPSPEWVKKVEWARKVFPSYGQDKPTQEGTQAKRQQSLELPGPSAKRSKIQPSVSFAEITKNRVLLGLINRGNPEGRIPAHGTGEARHLDLLHGRGLVPGQRQGGGLRQSAVGRLVQTGSLYK